MRHAVSLRNFPVLLLSRAGLRRNLRRERGSIARKLAGQARPYRGGARRFPGCPDLFAIGCRKKIKKRLTGRNATPIEPPPTTELLTRRGRRELRSLFELLLLFLKGRGGQVRFFRRFHWQKRGFNNLARPISVRGVRSDRDLFFRWVERSARCLTIASEERETWAAGSLRDAYGVSASWVSEETHDGHVSKFIALLAIGPWEQRELVLGFWPERMCLELVKNERGSRGLR